MREIGKVLAILDDTRLLVSIAEEKVSEDETYRVFERVAFSSPSLDIDHLDVPKGKVSLVVLQAMGVWLAETFDEAEGKRVFVPEPSAFDRLRAAAVHGFNPLGTPALKLTREEPRPSAVLDTKSALGIKVGKAIKAGDLIAAWD